MESESVLPTVSLNTALIAFRVLVSTKEAGTIIGKNGSCVAAIREKTGVKSGVSKVIIGSPERILTVSGPVDATAVALGMFAQALLESSQVQEQSFSYFPLKSLCGPKNAGQTSLRVLIPHSQMGTLIGKSGSRIKLLQQKYRVKIVASKDFLADSTERVVEVQGAPDDIAESLKVVAHCLIEDWHGATGTVYYVPSARKKTRSVSGGAHVANSGNAGGAGGAAGTSGGNTEPQTVQELKLPSEFVGCVIGKRGAKIQEIRKVSGAQVSIASEDDDDDQRTLEISGSQFAVEKALSLIYQNVQKEKERRDLD